MMDDDSTIYKNTTKEKLKEYFPVITDDDLNFREGKEKEMMEMLVYKIGITKEELVNIINYL
jgi:hypothetical protein